MGAGGGMGGGRKVGAVSVTGMREMCSILPESRFPPIRYCHRAPNRVRLTQQKRLKLAGGTFWKFTKGCSTNINPPFGVSFISHRWYCEKGGGDGQT